MTESQKSVLPLVCSGCGKTAEMQLQNWRCDRCGAAWLPADGQPLKPEDIRKPSHDILS